MVKNTFRFHTIILFFFFSFCTNPQKTKNSSENSFPVVKKNEKEASAITFFLNDKKEMAWINVHTWPEDMEPYLIQLGSDFKSFTRKIIAADTVEVTMGSIGVYYNAYRFNPGDSVVITFNTKKEPVINIPNRPCNDFEVNFYNHLNKNILGINLYLFKDENKTFKGNTITPEESYKKSLGFLEKLFQSRKVSSSFYNYTNNRLKTMYYENVLYGRSHTKTIIDKSFLAKDNLLKYSFYRGLLALYLQKSLLFAKSEDDIDYKKAYELVSTNFSGGVRDYLLFYSLINLQTTDRIDSFSYLPKFNKDCSNNSYKNYINTNFGNKNLYARAGESILLQATSGQKADLMDILKNFKNNVIYINFWASWCTPCRMAMPSLIQLQSQFSNKDIIFLYISIDDKITAWRSAQKAENLDTYEYSYLLLNPRESGIMKQLKLNSIPRYILFDKQGKLVSPKAPAPGSMGIKNLLNKYLN